MSTDSPAPARSSRFTRLTRGRGWKTYAALGAGLVVLALAGVWLFQQFTHVAVSDARVAADMVSISSRVSGQVDAVNVIEGDQAGKGHVLVSIDARESRLQVDELDARLSGVEGQREELRARRTMLDHRSQSQINAQMAALSSAKSALASAMAQRDLAKTATDRAENLAAKNAISTAQLDERRAALETASQGVLSARADIQSAQAGLEDARAAREEIGVLESQLAELDPQEKQLRAQKGRAELDGEYRQIVMPFDGVVDQVFVDPGEVVAPGQRLALVHNPQAVRVEANVKETDIRYFQPGKHVAVKVDAFPGRDFDGVVESVGQSATSEFALLPNPNPSGNFTKITQRLPVRVTVTGGENLLKPGMMVQLQAHQ